MQSKKIGRPTDNPKTINITIRLDNATNKALNEYCKEHGILRAEAIRRAIMML